MKRRLVSLGLVAALLPGPVLPAAPRCALTRAGVVAAANREQVEALCAAVRGSSAEVRVSERGGIVRLEILAANPEQLAGALAALRQAARTAGVKVRFQPDEPESLADGLAPRSDGTPAPERPTSARRAAAVMPAACPEPDLGPSAGSRRQHGPLSQPPVPGLLAARAPPAA